jgi:hypothetical protein
VPEIFVHPFTNANGMGKLVICMAGVAVGRRLVDVKLMLTLSPATRPMMSILTSPPLIYVPAGRSFVAPVIAPDTTEVHTRKTKMTIAVDITIRVFNVLFSLIEFIPCNKCINKYTETILCSLP